ncbi:MAG: VWA domain-containing protein [Candidatus Schekmanbacteria bacterium]|nr:VWA domain-containing protein [Candidatus Schekmanbacteria bacterium]
MRILYPYYLILLILIPLSWFISRKGRDYFRPSQYYTFNGLRTLIWILLILALAGLEISLGRMGNMNFFWVWDISNSITARQKQWFKDYMVRTGNSLPGGAKVSVALCGRETKTVLELSDPDKLEDFLKNPPAKTPNPDFSNLAAGIESIVSMASVKDTNRIILLSDGNENVGNLVAAARTAGGRGLPIYPIIPPVAETREIVMEEMSLPSEVKKGEAFEVKVNINNLNLNGVNTVIRLYIEDKEVVSDPTDLLPGLNVHKWIQVINNVGPVFYTAKVSAEDDTNQQNNETMGAVTVIGDLPKVLCVEGKSGESEFLAQVLSSNGLEVEVATANQFPQDYTKLGTYAGVIFNNVPRQAVSLAQMNMIKRYVSDLGGGFMMLGGEESFSSGGYYKTPLEEILPVNMDQNVSYKFKQVMLVVLIDRSSSMEGMKMDMARKATVRIMKELRDSDMLGLVLFDSKYEDVTGFRMLWGNRDDMTTKIGMLAARKGGTNLYPAIEHAYDLLQNASSASAQAPVQIKHILILSDGRTYKDKSFEQLARKISAAGITISTLALGQEADAKLLTNIAREGRGLFHQPDDMQKLPELFVTDLEDAISKTPFIEKPFTPEVASSSPIITGIDAAQLPPLKGYMVTKPKPAANMVLVSKARGFSDPVLAHHRYGFGVTIAYTSDVVPRWATQWISWNSFSKFWVQAVRYMLRQEDADWAKIQVQRIPEGAQLTVNIAEKNAPQGELAVYAAPSGGKEQHVALERISLGKYRGIIRTETIGRFIISLREKVANSTVTRFTRAIVIPPFLGEHLKFTPNEQLLRRVAKVSGGEFNPKSNQILMSAPEKTAHFTPVWQYLLGLALVIFVVEIGLRKWWL